MRVIRIMVDYNGWRKVLEVPDVVASRGCVELSVMPPLDLRPCVDMVPTNRSAVRIVAYATGERVNGLPLFKGGA